MDSKISIRIKIAEREYPMTIFASDEERIRKAASVINQRMEKYAKANPRADKLDLFAMVAFDSLNISLSVDDKTKRFTASLSESIDELEALIQDSLQHKF